MSLHDSFSPFFFSWRLKYFFFLVFMIHFKCCAWIKGYPPPLWALNCHKIVYWEDCLHSTELLFSVFTKITLPYGSGFISRLAVLFQWASSLFIADTLRSPCFYHVLWGSACHVFSILSVENAHTFFQVFCTSYSVLSSNILLQLNELISSSDRLYFPKWLQRCFHLPFSSRILSLCLLLACVDWAFVTVWTTRMWQRWRTLHSQARLGQVALRLELSTLGIKSPGFNKPRRRGPSSRPAADARQ